MKDSGFKIGTIFGIPIYLHTSWFFIFALITYSLGLEFAATHPLWTRDETWGLALATSALFFGSVVFHELAHSVVAMFYKIPVGSITLFFFGGVSSITREPDHAGQEFQIAFAGPFSSLVLAGAFWLLAGATPPGSALNELGTWLSRINLSLGIFNLILPGFPLDGGRILRSIVWGVTKNYDYATRVAVRGGQVVAYGLMAVGFVLAFGRSINLGPLHLEGGSLNGLWLVFIGWFLLSAARQSYAQLTTRGALEGLHASDVMTADLPTVPRDISLEEYAREVARTGRRSHLVVADGQLVGFMSLELLQSVPRDDWNMTAVQAVMTPRDKLQWAAPDEPVLQLMERMGRAGLDQMAVVNAGNVVGMVTRDSIARVVQMRDHLGRHLASSSS